MGKRRHGAYVTPEYKAWVAMRDRCRNPNNKKFHLYGGKGVKVCDRWMASFENFLADMGERPSSAHSLDRRDGNGDYEPTNCRWATPREQGNNTSQNRLLTFAGKTQTMAEWARERGWTYQTVRHRIQRGWPVELALTTPDDKSSAIKAALRRNNAAAVRRGERINTAKLTTEDVREIRRQLAEGTRGATLARQYHISQSAISAIKHRKTWLDAEAEVSCAKCEGQHSPELPCVALSAEASDRRTLRV